MPADAKYYALLISAADGRMVVGCRYDGGLEYGPAFTTPDAAAKLFWEAMAAGAKTAPHLKQQVHEALRSANVLFGDEIERVARHVTNRLIAAGFGTAED